MYLSSLTYSTAVAHPHHPPIGCFIRGFKLKQTSSLRPSFSCLAFDWLTPFDGLIRVDCFFSSVLPRRQTQTILKKAVKAFQDFRNCQLFSRLYSNHPIRPTHTVKSFLLMWQFLSSFYGSGVSSERPAAHGCCRNILGLLLRDDACLFQDGAVVEL